MRTSRALVATSVTMLLLSAFPPFAIGAENRLPEGTHDGFDQLNARRGECYANGWAVDPDDVDAPVTVRILVDGVVLTELEATEYRQDIVDAGIDPDGTAGFTVFMGLLDITFDVPHEVLVEARDAQTAEWRVLDSSPRTIVCSNLLGFHDTASGVVDRQGCVAEGWAADRDTELTQRARVRIKVDGKVVAETTADQFRQDVLDVGVGDGFYGWSVDLFGMVTPSVEHVVRAEMRDTTLKRLWLPLFDTDKPLTCLADGVRTVQGEFNYTTGSGSKAVVIDGRSAGQARGTWTLTTLNDGVTHSGEITCLITKGGDAWVAGPETSSTGNSTAGMFFRLHDGGASGDLAVTFVADPGMTFEGDILPMCQQQKDDLSLFALDSGQLTVGAR